jgi:hypothetical protein
MLVFSRSPLAQQVGMNKDEYLPDPALVRLVGLTSGVADSAELYLSESLPTSGLDSSRVSDGIGGLRFIVSLYLKLAQDRLPS